MSTLTPSRARHLLLSRYGDDPAIERHDPRRTPGLTVEDAAICIAAELLRRWEALRQRVDLDTSRLMRELEGEPVAHTYDEPTTIRLVGHRSIRGVMRPSACYPGLFDVIDEDGGIRRYGPSAIFEGPSEPERFGPPSRFDRDQEVVELRADQRKLLAEIAELKAQNATLRSQATAARQALGEPGGDDDIPF